VPSVTTCINASVPNGPAPPPPAAPPSPPPPFAPPPAPAPTPAIRPVNALSSPGSAQPQFGLWANTAGVFMYHSPENMCATRYEDGALKAQYATFTSYQCTGDNTFYQTMDLAQYLLTDPTTPQMQMSICLSGSRNTTTNKLTVFMTAFGPCPAAVEGGPGSFGVLELLQTTLVVP